MPHPKEQRPFCSKHGGDRGTLPTCAAGASMNHRNRNRRNINARYRSIARAKMDEADRAAAELAEKAVEAARAVKMKVVKAPAKAVSKAKQFFRSMTGRGR